MDEKTIIIHGWSDCSESFVKLKKYLSGHGLGPVDTIYYVDYESREDNITFEDVVEGLNDRLQEQGFIDENGNKLCDMNVIVHSTGGLVVRHWLWRYYYRDGDRIADCPVKRLVMLAPANFGSPLAHKGNSFVGMIFKGRHKLGDFFEVGKNILLGLELGSPYQWQLASRDLLVAAPYFTADKIQATILVGGEPYEGLRKLVNKPGTDGTVVISGTTLNMAKLILDYSDPRKPLSWQMVKTAEDIAFGVLHGVNHGSITDPDDAPEAAELLRTALSANGANEFKQHQGELQTLTEKTYANYAQSGPPEVAAKYQQFLLHAIDDQEQNVHDYSLDVYLMKDDNRVSSLLVKKSELTDAEEKFTGQLYDALFSQSHEYTEDSSYRRLLVNVDNVREIIKKAEVDLGNIVISLKVFISAVDKGISFNNDGFQNIVIYRTNEKKPMTFFYENTTTLVEIRARLQISNEYVDVGLEPKDH